jgi:hypothetical protein
LAFLLDPVRSSSAANSSPSEHGKNDRAHGGERLDIDVKALRRELPWCKKLPREYFLGHVLIATQPFDVDSADDPVIEPLEAAGAVDAMGSRPITRKDTDVLGRAMSAMPAHLHERVLRANAACLYGLELPVAAGTLRASRSPKTGETPVERLMRGIGVCAAVISMVGWQRGRMQWMENVRRPRVR